MDLKFWLSRILPYTCILCAEASTQQRDICVACEADFPMHQNACLQCGNHLLMAGEKRYCGACLNHPPAFDRLLALCDYAPPIDRMLIQAKFHAQLIHLEILSALLSEKIIRQWYNESPLPHYIIPIPLHRKRLRERGYNQALELAKPISRQLHTPLRQDICIRAKPTVAQSTLPHKERQENVRHAFKVNTSVKDQHIAIVDDIVTTGHTVNALSLLLKEAGAKQIDIWCCAKTQCEPVVR